MVGEESRDGAREPRAAAMSDREALGTVIAATLEMAVKLRSDAATLLLRRALTLLQDRDAEERPFRPS